MRSLILAFAAAIATCATAQVGPAPQHDFTTDVDSGRVVNAGAARAVIWAGLVQDPGADWVRLEFEAVTLGRAPQGAKPTVLRVSSLADGAIQTLDATALAQWQLTSAYFNGDTVLIEILADPGAAPSHVRILRGWGGNPVMPDPLQSICGPDDDRILSNSPRSARVSPVGCSAWIIDDPNHTFLSAGHCVGTSFQTVQFNVPLSNSGGGWNHPGPEDQYAVDDASMQSAAGGIGNDWAYFGCFANTETGLTPFEAQQAFYVLDHTPPPDDGRMVDITGYGTTSSPAPPQWNAVQKVHRGPYEGASGTSMTYVVDTTGGNSGSAVLDLTTLEAIAIHTNGGCSSGGGANLGCALNNAGLINALLNPKGVCIPIPKLTFDFPDGLPTLLPAAGGTFRFNVLGANGGTPAGGTGRLYLDTGTGFVEYVMTEVAPDAYEVDIPAIECGSNVSFYVSAETTTGLVVSDPTYAPDTWHSATVATDIDVTFYDDGETDAGWIVTDGPDLVDGSWTRGTPVGGGDRGDPADDADGSGQCWLTDNVDGNSDVDGGATTLTSPVLDASHPDATLGYWRWYSNSSGGNGGQDVFTVDVSDDGGTSWSVLEVIGPGGPDTSGGWRQVSIRVADIAGIANTAAFRIRFTASDPAPGAVVEAAVDGLAIRRLICDDPCPAEDLDGDCLVGFGDLLTVLGAWGPCGGCPADLDANGAVDFDDLLQVLTNWS